MPGSPPSAGEGTLVSRSAAGLALSQSLRLFVGRGRRYSYKQIRRGTGIPERMLECYLQEPDHPDWRPIKPEELASLFYFLRADFATDYLERIAGLCAYEKPEPDAMPPGDIAADIAEDAAQITRAAADNDFGPNVRSIGTRLMSRGAQLRHMGSLGQGELFGRAVA